MDYWAETMQDDAYLIAADGWVAKTSRVLETDKKGKTKDKGWTCELIPKSLIFARYFASKKADIDAAQEGFEDASTGLSELEEEHGGDEGFLGALDKIAKAEVGARLREIESDREAEEEAAVLKRWLDLSDGEAMLKRAVKDGEESLGMLSSRTDIVVLARSPSVRSRRLWLTTSGWHACRQPCRARWSVCRKLLPGESARWPSVITWRPPRTTDEVAALAVRVEGHLARMGASWE